MALFQRAAAAALPPLACLLQAVGSRSRAAALAPRCAGRLAHAAARSEGPASRDGAAASPLLQQQQQQQHAPQRDPGHVDKFAKALAAAGLSHSAVLSVVAACSSPSSPLSGTPSLILPRVQALQELFGRQCANRILVMWVAGAPRRGVALRPAPPPARRPTACTPPAARLAPACNSSFSPPLVPNPPTRPAAPHASEPSLLRFSYGRTQANFQRLREVLGVSDGEGARLVSRHPTVLRSAPALLEKRYQTLRDVLQVGRGTWRGWSQRGEQQKTAAAGVTKKRAAAGPPVRRARGRARRRKARPTAHAPNACASRLGTPAPSWTGHR
jgi:hypothetical protein